MPPQTPPNPSEDGGFSLSDAQAQWVRRLLVATDSLPQRMAGLLQAWYFNEAGGRALILQPGRAFGYFYLRRDLFEQADRLAWELRALLDLCLLVARLREHRLVYVFTSAVPAPHGMVCVSDLFQDPHPGTAHLVLNKRGDYSFQPEAIQNAGDDVTYRGVRLEGPVFDVVAQCVDGMLCIPDDCRPTLRGMVADALARTAAERGRAAARSDPNASKRRTAAWALAAALGLLAALAAAWMLSRHGLGFR